MKAQLITWALVALGLALVVQVLGPILTTIGVRHG